ncbi:triose-phosphate isomerase [Longimonas halophila]|uniref:Triosephosphate isomerase n=1 Tax=Longimonas halophila TaxID=1469170 RepID=A0A2H3NMI8_9BACT|nr:triose-phosphate isomerase [Longimonas halophila]PEN07669.1 triose-phosphate isomerase [Longimonas halophila]
MLIAGNWKMNTTLPNAQSLAQSIATGYLERQDTLAPIDMLVCPPDVNLQAVGGELAETPVALGGQHMHHEDAGAFTGEVSAPMLKAVGCTHVIVGHSERRQLFGLSDADVNAQVKQAQAHDLIPVICVGETKPERDAGNAKDVVRTQLHAALNGASVAADDVIIAYEPVWAIGTGDSATPEQAQEMHAFVRSELAALHSPEDASGVHVLYGGSMKPHNAEALLGQPDVNGGLIGGASLTASDFLTIAEIGAAEVAS